MRGARVNKPGSREVTRLSFSRMRFVLQQTFKTDCTIVLDKRKLDGHVHGDLGVGMVVMENEVLKHKLVNVRQLSPQLQSWEWPRTSLQLDIGMGE